MDSSRWASPPTVASTLSGDTAPFHPSDPVPQQPLVPGSNEPPAPMDEFAQTRPPDDLFGDDFTPIDEPKLEDVVPQTHPAKGPPHTRPQRGGPGGGFRGRGRGRGGQFQHTTRAPQQQSQTQTKDSQSTAPPAVKPPADIPSTADSEAPPQPTHNAPPNAPKGPKNSTTTAPPSAPAATAAAVTAATAAATTTTASTTPSVRGDRTATGGTPRTKLTEEELTARMEAMKLKNASREAAHARAEADEASFHAREQEARERRRVEGVNRKAMEGERERNRLRKLKAQGGRDWDVNKEESETAARGGARGRGSRRGAFGGVVGGIGGEAGVADDVDVGADETQAARGGQRGRGRGRGQGRGRGRGGAENNTIHPVASGASQQVPNEEDFPALATAPKAKDASEKPVTTVVTTSYPPKSSGEEAFDKAGNQESSKPQRSWAEEMESSPITPLPT